MLLLRFDRTASVATAVLRLLPLAAVADNVDDDLND